MDTSSSAPPLVERAAAQPLSARNRSNCGVGVLMNLDGRRTHALVDDALGVLERLDHRGARGAEAGTGDGAGVLLQKPHAFFDAAVGGLGPADGYGVGQLFLPPDPAARGAVRRLLDRRIEAEGFRAVGWRAVPTEPDGLGPGARKSEPSVWQVFVRPVEALAPEALDRRLYVLRRLLERAVAESDLEGRDRFYVCSLDRRRIVYKGLLTNAQVRSYYPDLSDERVRSSLALVHSRFSTNTLGAWRLAHPYRTVVHNGEVNTLCGNLNWMRARGGDLASERLGADLDRIRPVTTDAQSDTAVLDNVLELLTESGRSLPHALRMLVPEAWSKDEAMDPARRAWYDYHSTLIEPWDGPLLVACTDGESVGAVLDRNGLRPCRYWVTDADRLVMASETGVVDVPPERVVRTDRLRPGELFLADADEGRIVPEEEVFARLTDAKYARWLDRKRVRLADLTAGANRWNASSGDAAPDDSAPDDSAPDDSAPDDSARGEPASDTTASGKTTSGKAAPQNRDSGEAAAGGPARPYLLGEADALARRQRAFGYTLEHVRRFLAPMAESGADPVGAMGDDTPPAVLSGQSKPLFHYFQQLFAQVSNPPLDYIREALVTSLESHLGRRNNLLGESPEHCRQLHLASPVLNDAGFAAVAGLDVRGIRSARVDLTFAPSRDLSSALDRIRRRARQAISDGHEVLVLTDRAAGPDRLPVPSLLAVGAVHHDLIRAERRTRAGLVLDSGQPCLVHHFCTLLGYGADAVYPRLAFRSVRALANAGDALGPPAAALDRYVEALEQGLLKVMAKMGISTLESYKGAQAFEAVGLDGALIDAHFTGTASRLGGAGLPEIEADLRERHAAAYRARGGGAPALATGGDHYWRRDGEHHRWNPRTIGRLQQAVRNGDRAAYDAYAEAANAATPDRQKLRGRLAFDAGPGDAIPVEDVEPAGEIVRRFFTSSMSFGSLSPEAHETLAVAMNRIGGRASTGEGGEQADRFGTERECAIKQVASGRFGVTSAYLESARCIEIKMAQGSKPGEGGHLPGEKVNEAIARTRCTTPGVSLISPPPHHDIYSIEDLAQLIHDLKRASPEAEVHVKLVASAGIGVIAAGVAKAKADAILVSGRSGGTGASPKTSIKSAGLPWELGLSEVQRVLRRTKLRSRVRLRVDGGLMTGRDVAVAALMGAERFGFGTAALVALGCVMLRKCHCNTCSVGIATQDASLRERFAGRPEHVVRFMHFVAEELREIMARLGVRSVDAMVGRTDRLKPAGPDEPSGDGRGAAARLDPSPLVGAPAGSHPTRKTREQDGPGGGGLAAALIEAARPALEHGTAVHIERPVTNRDRAVGARLSAEVSRRHGGDGLPAGTIRVSLTGVAGQSLGAFLAPGITLALEGEANDYVGKGLSGGHLAVRTPASAGYDPAESVLLGNVALYGATQGQAYVNGRAGERFAVRNSGVRAVVEGVGDHGCEYMTGGAVVVLGPTGRNFGAGMSGGEAYVLDADGTLEDRINPGMVHLEPLEDARDRRLVRRLVECHWHHTGSAQARRTLDRWDAACSRFRKVMPDAFAQKVRAGLEAGTDLRPPIPDPPPHARSAAA